MITRTAIKVKVEQCVMCEAGKLSPVWKRIERKPYCKYHAMALTAKKQVSINKEHNDFLEKFYKFIHEKYNYTCQETGKKLIYDKKHAAHILPKSKYDYFETDPRNGILLSWSIHGIIDKGSASQRKELKVWNTIQKTRKTLLEEVGLTFDAEHWENVTY